MSLALRCTCPLSLEQQSSTIDLGSKEAPFTTMIFSVGGIRILLDYRKRVIITLFTESKRYFFVSLATRRRELLVRGIPPSLDLSVNYYTFVISYRAQSVLRSQKYLVVNETTRTFLWGYTTCLKGEGEPSKG